MLMEGKDKFVFTESQMHALLGEITKAKRLVSQEKVKDTMLIEILNAALEKEIITMSKAAEIAGVNVMQFRILIKKATFNDAQKNNQET